MLGNKVKYSWLDKVGCYGIYYAYDSASEDLDMQRILLSNNIQTT